MGKGSTPRPKSVSPEKFSDAWDQVFGKNKENKKNKEKIPSASVARDYAWREKDAKKA